MLQHRRRRAASEALQALFEDPNEPQDEAPDAQDLVFENIPKGDPTRGIRWCTDKHINRRLITLRLAVDYQFCRGFLPNPALAPTIFTALEFPFEQGQEFNAVIVKKWTGMMEREVDPAKLGNGFVLDEIDRDGTKRLRITMDFKDHIMAAKFHPDDLKSEVPAVHVSDVEENGLAVNVCDNPHGLTYWVPKAVQALREAGCFQLGGPRPTNNLARNFVVPGVARASRPGIPRAPPRQQLPEGNYDEYDKRGREESAEAEIYTPGARSALRRGNRPRRLTPAAHEELSAQLQEALEYAKQALKTNVPLSHLLQSRGHDVNELLARVEDLGVGGISPRR
ncbi:Hypothetical predicted protein [Lecanosticta acicola]|uniref:Uncharacterized protein n=1 Tax=Lecanosticta acicola TaxID=111012 RepID=A0AAI9EC78_9PEZI|nr:Hypothetical predicted protein [Lecanosticta acicola]